MCGIAGIVSPSSGFIQQSTLQRMANALQHRGPDGEGFWINEQHSVGFAHRRLSVIDLSADAAQPLHYLHYTIIYNGEIYKLYRAEKRTAAARIFFFYPYRYRSNTCSLRLLGHRFFAPLRRHVCICFIQ